MMGKRLTFASLLAGTAVLLISLVGYSCINPFAPALADANAPHSNLLTQQLTPDEVLQNFEYAYTFKDSLVYAELLDTTFIFRSWDYNVTPPLPLEWGRDTELRTTARMFRFFSTIDLTWNATIYLFYDSTKTRAEMKKTFTLTFDGGRSIPTLNGEVIFKFIRRGKRWYIRLWEDLNI